MLGQIKYYLILIIIFTSCSSKEQLNKPQPVIDKYHNIELEDSYRHMENLKDTIVLDWFREEGNKAKKILSNISGKKKLIDLQVKFGDQTNDKIKNIQLLQGTYFYLKQSSTEDYYKLFYRKGLNGKEKLIYDYKDFQKITNEKYYINYYKPSWDGSKLLISFTKNGEEIATMRVFDMISKKLLPLIMSNSLPTFGGAYWNPSNTGVIYLQVPATNDNKDRYLNMEVVHQRLNKSTPEIIFSKTNNPSLNMKDKDIPVVTVTNEENKYIISAVAGVTKYQDLYYMPVGDFIASKTNWKALSKREDLITSFYQDKDSIVYLTSKNASNFKICKTSLKNPNLKNPINLVNESNDKVITDFKLVKDGIVYVTIKNGVEAKIYLRKNQGTIEELLLPVPAGRISIASDNIKDKNYLAITTQGWLNKNKRYEYDFGLKKFIEVELSSKNDIKISNDIIVEELEIASHDKVKVPLSLIYNKSLKKVNNTPVFMIAYGAYGSSISPKFTKKIMTWVNEGGIFAVAHVRGGGEKGDSWYKDGFKDTKPNTWKDLIACAEFLVKEKYTSKNNIAINGASAGGIAVGRAMTEKPDLFAAVIINVGYLNTVRIEASLNGKNNSKEFGTVEDLSEFKNLLEMDSYHKIRKGTKYPATLITTGMNDSRVPPWHSGKFVAKLKEINKSNNPILFKVDFETGHGNAGSKIKHNESTADILAFALWKTGHPDYQLISN